MFVRAQLSQGMKRDALLVPQRGVTRNQRGEATVMVVGEDNKVVERIVTAERVIDNEWLITKGLSAGERVVVDGLQKIQPGAEVRAVAAADSPKSTDNQSAAASEVARR